MLKKYTALTLLILFSLGSHADIQGVWQTIDDKSGKAKSLVQIREANGVYSGRITDLLLKPDDTVCKKCEIIS